MEKNLLKLKPDQVNLLKLSGTVLQDDHTYYFLPFWFKEVDEDNGVFESFPLGSLPAPLTHLIERVRSMPGVTISAELPLTPSETYDEVDKMIAPLPPFTETEALEVANRLLRQELGRLSEERDELKKQLNIANLSLINLGKTIALELEKINHDYIGFQQYPDGITGDADVSGSSL